MHIARCNCVRPSHHPVLYHASTSASAFKKITIPVTICVFCTSDRHQREKERRLILCDCPFSASEICGPAHCWFLRSRRSAETCRAVTRASLTRKEGDSELPTYLYLHHRLAYSSTRRALNLPSSLLGLTSSHLSSAETSQLPTSYSLPTAATNEHLERRKGVPSRTKPSLSSLPTEASVAGYPDQTDTIKMQPLGLVLTALSAAVFGATASSAATCVTSAANSTATSWAMNYASVEPPVSGTGYDIEAAFQEAYGFNSTMVMRSPPPPKYSPLMKHHLLRLEWQEAAFP